MTGSVCVLIVLSVISSVVGLASPWFTLNENQVLYLFSTSAQVIAAIYGLTLTGFLFFRSELSREAAEDETLAEAIDQIKARYFVLLVFITSKVGLTLLLANLVIAYETDPRTDITTVLLNVGQSAFAVSLLAITLFVFDVIAPQRIEKASKNLQDEVDPSRGGALKGSLEDFVRNYNEIESLLLEAGQPFQSFTTATLDARPLRRISNSRLADFLLRSELIDKSLFDRLRELITLRNAIIHGAEPVVSGELVAVSADVLRELRAALSR